MTPRQTHTVLLGRVTVCFFTAIYSLSTISAQVRNTSDSANVQILIRRLTDRSPSVRASAAHLLGQIGPEAAAAVPALIEGLKDDVDNVRTSVA